MAKLQAKPGLAVSAGAPLPRSPARTLVEDRTAMPRALVAIAFSGLPGCGQRARPAIDYLDAVEVELDTDGKEAFLYLAPKAKPSDSSGCPRFGAPATIDGR